MKLKDIGYKPAGKDRWNKRIDDEDVTIWKLNEDSWIKTNWYSIIEFTEEEIKALAGELEGYAKPREVVWTHDGDMVGYRCGNCHYSHTHPGEGVYQKKMKHCGNCGKALAWWTEK